MDWLEHGIYMVRDAGFGRDFTPKVWVTLIGLALVAWDVRGQRRWDYAWAGLVATVLWTGAEALLAVQGIRDMPVREIFGFPMPLWASYVLQGTSEAAFVLVLGLFIGDRLLVRSHRGAALAFFVGISALTVGSVWRLGALVDRGVVASRRDLLAPTALVALGVLTIVVLVFVIRAPRWRPRLLASAGVMFAFATIWTVAQVAVGGRWIEVRAASGGFERAPWGVSVAGLGFDIVVEIVVAYAAFLALCVWARLLPDPQPLREPGDSVMHRRR